MFSDRQFYTRIKIETTVTRISRSDHQSDYQAWNSRNCSLYDLIRISLVMFASSTPIRLNETTFLISMYIDIQSDIEDASFTTVSIRSMEWNRKRFVNNLASAPAGQKYFERKFILKWSKIEVPDPVTAEDAINLNKPKPVRRMALPLERVKSIKWFAKIRDAFSSVHYEPFFTMKLPR